MITTGRSKTPCQQIDEEENIAPMSSQPPHPPHLYYC